MKRILLVVMVVFFQGCTNSDRAGLSGWGKDFRVTLYSGGTVVREWKSSGKVQSESDSDGWYFMDSDTKKLVRVSGSVVVEQL